MPSYRLQELFHDLHEGIPALNIEDEVYAELETADVRMFARDDGTHDAYDTEGVIDEGAADAADLYETVLANIAAGTSIAWFPGDYSWNKEVTQSLGNIDWVTPGRSVRLDADSAITNYLTLRDAGTRIGIGPSIDGLTVRGNGNADRFLEADTVRYGRLRNLQFQDLTAEAILAYSDQDTINADNWSVRDVQCYGSRFATLRAGTDAMAADWDIKNIHVGGVPSLDWGLVLEDANNNVVRNLFAGNNSGTEIAGAVKVTSPGANAGATDPMSGNDLETIGVENTGVTGSGAVGVLFDGAGNRLNKNVVRGVKAVGDGVVPVQFANSGGTIRRNRGNVFKGLLTDKRPAAVVDADVLRAKVEAHPTLGSDTTAIVDDSGDFTMVNDLGKEAAGSGNAPSATTWEVGDEVENTDDGTVWKKTGPATFVQLG